MNKAIGLQLIVYSLLLAGFSYFAYRLAPELAHATIVTALAGGGLCLVWGLGAVLGRQNMAPPILTLLPIIFVMFAQTILALGGGSQKVAPDRTVAAVTVLLLVLSIVMLGRIARVGLAAKGRSPSPTEDGGSERTDDRESDSPG
jgi:hypothetical protein